MADSGAVRSARFRERQRERRHLGLSPAPVRKPPELLDAVKVTIGALNLAPEFAGVAQLARVLAEAIDQAENEEYAARWLMPELMKVLDALGGTPASRARMGKGEPSPPSGPSPLNQMRAARARRHHPV